jgi:hypothetical protein
MRPGTMQSHLTPPDPPGPEPPEYRSVSGLAVAGLAFGLLSAVAMIFPLLLTCAVVGIVLSMWALLRIRRQAPALAGRGIALSGLLLSVVFATAVPTDWLVYRWRIRNEARQFGEAWFELLSRGEPHKAHQLTVEPELRERLDDRLWASYREDPRRRKEIRKYASEPLVRTLLALDDRGQARLYETRDHASADGREYVQQVYAVTFEEEAGRKTFFVLMNMERSRPDSGRADWRLVGVQGGFRPLGW